MQAPDWLTAAIRSQIDPSNPENLLFHGTIEPFEGNLRPTKWEGLLWFSDSPVVSQSYCAVAGLSALWSFQKWRAQERFVPVGDLDQKLFAGMGFDVAAMDIKMGSDGRADSYRLVPNHPTYADAAHYVEHTLGYTLEEDCCWITLKHDRIMPAAWKEQGRLYIAEKPASLNLYDMRGEEGGLTGRQWMATDRFAQAQAQGYDGVIISDVHHTKRLGHFEHSSWGLFGHVIEQLKIHCIPCKFFDPADAWYGEKVASTPEWIELVKRTEKEAA